MPTNKTLDMLNIVPLKESINELLRAEGKYAPVATVCKAYIKKLDEGMHEEEICDSFIKALQPVAIHESAKDVLFRIGNDINEHKRDLDIVNRLYEMSRGQYHYVVPMLESCVVDYLTDKNSDTRSSLRQKLSLFEGIKEINDILESLSFDEYEEKMNIPLKNSSLNEALTTKEKTYSQEEVDKLLESQKEEISNKINESKETAVKRGVDDIDSHIYLSKVIKSILLKEGKNESLKTFCSQYINALNAGKPEETLYESFISGVSNWNYLSAVDTELSALKDRINKYQQDVDLKKILRVMENTGSYYIVPLIEGCVADYVDNKSMQNKAILKQRLQAFEYDPFVRDILNVVMHDLSMENTVYLGESVENINSVVHTEKIFSPVKYIKENECVFNVKGTYYNRKGNTITRLSKSSVNNLDESFKTLCNLINHPAVSIDDMNNVISIYEGNDCAKISDTAIILNEKQITTSELENLAKASHIMNEHKEGFYAAINMINEKFNEIAYIDFVKRVAMNESDSKSVDVFRIKNNLFVTTTDNTLGTSTFYRNVNPIQCRSYINEHMSINVSPMFEDILPNQHAILEGVEEAKKEYETYIEELKNKKSEFERMKDETNESDGAEADIDKAIKLIDDEIADMEKDYEKYKKDSEEFIKGDDTDEPDDTTSAGNDGDDAKDGDTTDDTADDSTEEPTETPAQMEEPITEPADDDITAMQQQADSEQAAIDSATPYDPDFDTLPELPVDDQSSATDSSKADVKVLRVSYGENVKTGKKENKGTAYIVIPSVDANGDLKDETKMVTFYLDKDRRPIINNDYMPLMIYNAIVNAISEDPDTQSIDVASVADNSDSLLPMTDETPEQDTTTIEGTFIEEPVDSTPDDSDDTTMTDDEMTDSSTNDENEPMFGLEPEDDSTQSDDDHQDLTDDDINFDDMSDDSSISISDDDIDSLVSNDDTTGDQDDNEHVDNVEQEGPAETEERSDAPMYPIEVGLNTNDIKPISKTRFTEALKEMGIDCSQVEGDSNSVVMNFKNKAEVFALHDFFKDWKNYSKAEFCTFFPELKKCFDNKPGVPIQKISEGVEILNIHPINESILVYGKHKGEVSLVLPYTNDYVKLFGITPSKKHGNCINIVTESYEETKDVYTKLCAYAKTRGSLLDEDCRSFIDKYATEFKGINESIHSLRVPYNCFLEQKLDSKGIVTSHINESLNISLQKDDLLNAKKIFEQFYSEKTPVSVKKFLNEGLKITVRDDKSGQTIEFNTDDLKTGGDDDNDDGGNFTDSFKGTTFEPDNSSLFNSSDEDADDDKDEKKKHKDDESANESEESETPADQLHDVNSDTDEKSNADEKTSKKKFMFRKKKKSTNESVNQPKEVNHLNESSVYTGGKPNVLDWVKLKNGKSGQVISNLPMSENLIVNVEGHTVEVSPKDVDMLCSKKDVVDNPYRFDDATLKGLFEHMTQCGMFMNGIKLTPDDCYVKYGEYVNAKPDQKIRIVVEGEKVMADKKFIQITEDLNSFAIPAGYVAGKEITDSGDVLRDILVNSAEFSSNAPYVHCLVKNDNTDEFVELELLRETISIDSL